MMDTWYKLSQVSEKVCRTKLFSILFIQKVAQIVWAVLSSMYAKLYNHVHS